MHGIGFFGLLGVVFIVLKLMLIIHWSWWLVLLPLYGGIVLALVLVVSVLLWVFSKELWRHFTKRSDAQCCTGGRLYV